MRRGRHQQEVTSDVAQLLAELEALGLLELAPEVVGAHPVGLVNDHEVPLRLGKLGEQVLVASQLIHAGDQQWVLLERVGAEHRFAELRREDLEGEPELQVELVLPLVDEAARGDDEAALDVLAQDELLDVEPSHDRLAGAWVVGEQEAQRRARQQLAVDRAQLMRQWLNIGRRDRQHRVGEASQLDALALGDELEVGGDSVEGTRLGVRDREHLLGLATEHTLAQLALGGLVRQLDGVCAVRLSGEHGNMLPRDHTCEQQSGLDVLEFRHRAMVESNVSVSI